MQNAIMASIYEQNITTSSEEDPEPFNEDDMTLEEFDDMI